MEIKILCVFFLEILLIICYNRNIDKKIKKEMEFMKEELKNIFLMGLGAMSMTNDKAQELKKELLAKGEKMLEKGKVANEELKHNIKETLKENVTVVVEEYITKEKLQEKVKSLSKEEKEELLKLLKEETKNKNEK